MMKRNISYQILIFELVLALALALYNTNVCAYDPDPVENICVPIDHPVKKGVHVNGRFCKNPENVMADDFFYPHIDNFTDENSIWKLKGTVVDINLLPGLNTLGVAVAYTEIAPGGVTPAHIHERASEVMAVLEGNLKVGFVTSNIDGNRLFKKTLKKGDTFAFPIGLVHFQENVGDIPATLFHAYGSQSPGVTIVPNALFATKPPIKANLLAKSFQVKDDIIEHFQSMKWAVEKITNNNH